MARNNTNLKKKGSTANTALGRTVLNLSAIAKWPRMIAHSEAKKANSHPVFGQFAPKRKGAPNGSPFQVVIVVGGTGFEPVTPSV